jgi:hypothetical protein
MLAMMSHQQHTSAAYQHIQPDCEWNQDPNSAKDTLAIALYICTLDTNNILKYLHELQPAAVQLQH